MENIYIEVKDNKIIEIMVDIYYLYKDKLCIKDGYVYHDRVEAYKNIYSEYKEYLEEMNGENNELLQAMLEDLLDEIASLIIILNISNENKLKINGFNEQNLKDMEDIFKKYPQYIIKLIKFKCEELKLRSKNNIYKI